MLRDKIEEDKKKHEPEGIKETPLDSSQNGFGGSDFGLSATVTSVPVNYDPPHVNKSPRNTHFYMSAKLENTRIKRDVSRLVDEIINRITSIDGSEIEISLDLNATVKKDIFQNRIRTVSENCRTLKVKNFGFDE